MPGALGRTGAAVVGLGQRSRGPQAALLDPRAHAGRRVALEPGERRGRRPTGDSSSARRSAATARRRASRAVTAAVSAGRLGAAGRPEQHEVERPVDIEREPPAASEVVDLVACDLLEPARQGVVAGEVGDDGQCVGARDRHDVGRVAVVRQGRRPSRGRGRDEGPAVCVRAPAGPRPSRGRRGRAAIPVAMTSRSRSPNERSSATPPMTSASSAPASRKARRWLSATSDRAAATHRLRAPAAGSGPGWRMRTATGGMLRV